ncbi:hypothetical protein IL306_002592 [Fusarium sp. DS 682]|nr:hypothetical protein IL306_002592 [Fusarium sp. DS 682]
MTSYYGGYGPMLNAVLWVQVVVFAVFVGLRLYTRSQILHSVGADDYLVIIALVLQIIYSAFVTAGTKYGLGRKFADVGNPDVYFKAVEMEIYSQVAGLMVIGVGKCAVGIFLLRIVRNKFQKAFIWAFLAGTTFITLFSSIVVVVQCDPVQRTWDRRVPGTCWIDFSKVGLTVGSWFVVADFCFAILPWFVIWELNMKRKEKITVACGLSLGIFAGICGIVRTVALNGLNASEYIYDTVDMLIWSATESTVTIMCSSIPVLRPLYVRFRYGSQGDSSGAGSSYKLPINECKKKKLKKTLNHREDDQLKSHNVTSLSQRVIALQNQVNALTSALQDVSQRLPQMTLSSTKSTPQGQGSTYRKDLRNVRNEPRQPQFVGPTRSAYSFQIAENSLTGMGIEHNATGTSTPAESPSETEPVVESEHLSPGIEDIEILSSLGIAEVQRLLDVYNEEIQSVYPFIDVNELSTKAVSVVQAPTESTLKDVQAIKLAVATSVAIEAQGLNNISKRLIDDVEPVICRVSGEAFIDLQELQLMIMLVSPPFTISTITNAA